MTGHEARVYDAAGVLVDAFPFGGPVSSGANQMTILLATQEAVDLLTLDPRPPDDHGGDPGGLG